MTGSVGIGTSKLMAKIGSDLQKPDGLVVVPPGTELDVLHPLSVTTARRRRARRRPSGCTRSA